MQSFLFLKELHKMLSTATMEIAAHSLCMHAVFPIGCMVAMLLSTLPCIGLMDEAELEEVIHLVDRQKKKLHFADSLMHVQPAHKELRQLPLFQGLSDADFARVRTQSCGSKPGLLRLCLLLTSFSTNAHVATFNCLGFRKGNSAFCKENTALLCH